MTEIEERIVRLEEQAYFQDSLLKELDSALQSQQLEIDHLRVVVETMREELTCIRELLAARGEDARPPHYLPEEFHFDRR